MAPSIAGRARPVKRVLGLVRTTVLVWMAVVAVGAAGQASDEAQVKAAFLYNFAKFVQWPGDAASSPLTIGIIGDDEFANRLEQVVKGKALQGRTLVVQRVAKYEVLRDYDIVFVSGAAERQIGEVLARVGDASVLTVGESRTFLRDGGLIRLYPEGNRLRFEINVAGAERAGLKMSAQLLSLSRQ